LEAPEPDEPPRSYVRRIAAEKARGVAHRLQTGGDTRPVLAADTIVVLGDMLGKPESRDAALNMLLRLSGQWHEVITAFCLIDARGSEQRQEVVTRVQFKQLLPREIEAYLALGEWRDKAGGYGIQGGAAFMVRQIGGSYTNVVGLPLCEAVEALSRLGLTVGQRA